MLIVCVAEVMDGSLRVQEAELAEVALFELAALPSWPSHWPLASVFHDYRRIRPGNSS